MPSNIVRLYRQLFVIFMFASVLSCGSEVINERGYATSNDANPIDPDDAAIDMGPTTEMFDLYAMAYFQDGSLGPRAAVIKMEYLIANKNVEVEFWHGHNGVMHKFVLGPAEFAKIKSGEKFELETTEVDGHTHKLFIDSSDLKWRVENAVAKKVPIKS